MVDYAIVGGGRLARHFSHYFHLLEIPHHCWARDRHSRFNTFDDADAGLRLQKCVDGAERVLLLVSDNAISAILEQYPFLHQKNLIHCSGAISLEGVAGAHPLMTFADSLYDLQTYQSIPFVVEAGWDFASLFPGLTNPAHIIGTGEKAGYHALCVLAGNFTQLLWGGVADRFEKQCQLPAEALHPYLNQVLDNFLQNPGASLTGPLVRDDMQTIERNLGALSDDPMQQLYRAFVNFYRDDDACHASPEQTP